MVSRFPDGKGSLSLRERNGVDSSSASRTLARVRLCAPLAERLKLGRDRAAFEYLARETALSVINGCVERIPDQQVQKYLVEQILLTASLLASEAYTGVEEIRSELKELSVAASSEEARESRRRYDRHVETLGQHFFALGRRLHQLEQFMFNCPLSGSGEELRGLYGQKVRDLAGDLRFMRQELSRWIRRFVPIRRDQSGVGVDRALLEGRIDAVVDELGLRLREVHETLSAVVYHQLALFEPGLTRKKLFRRDLENVLDLGQLLEWLSNLFDRVKEFDEERRSDQLGRVHALLAEFRPAQFLSFSGVRDSEQMLFLRSVDELKRYQPAPAKQAEDDPIKVFLLLTGNLIASLRRQHRT